MRKHTLSREQRIMLDEARRGNLHNRPREAGDIDLAVSACRDGLMSVHDLLRLLTGATDADGARLGETYVSDRGPDGVVDSEVAHAYRCLWTDRDDPAGERDVHLGSVRRERLTHDLLILLAAMIRDRSGAGL